MKPLGPKEAQKTARSRSKEHVLLIDAINLSLVIAIQELRGKKKKIIEAPIDEELFYILLNNSFEMAKIFREFEEAGWAFVRLYPRLSQDKRNGGFIIFYSEDNEATINEKKLRDI